MQYRYKGGDEDMKPGVITYSSVINAHAQQGNAERAEALWEEMYLDFMNGNESAKPNIQSLNIVLDAWSTISRGATTSRNDSFKDTATL
jgi:pentatricopeptide repeat protein